MNIDLSVRIKHVEDGNLVLLTDNRMLDTYIENLKQVYGCSLTAADSHNLREAGE